MLLAIQEETAHHVERAELHVSDPQPLHEDSWRHEQRIGDNFCLPLPGGAPLEERAQESWMAALRMERALSELTRENTRLRQLLAQVEFNSQLSPRGLHVPAAPATAPRGPQGSGEPLGHETPREGQGPALRTQGPAVPCRLDSVQGSRVPTLTIRTQHQPIFSLFKIVHNISLCFPCLTLFLFFSLILATVT